MIKFDMDTRWYIDRVLEGTEKEILFITAEAAGIKIYESTRKFLAIDTYPYTAFSAGKITGSCIVGEPTVKYEDVLNILRDMIAQQVKIQDNVNNKRELDNVTEAK